MGQHFDCLVEVVRRHISPEETASGMQKPLQYFTGLIQRAALFDFPLNAEEIFPKTGKDMPEYNRYLQDYFEMSAKYGKTLITPFRLTAIEDRDSVVVLDHLQGNDFRVTFGRKDILPTFPPSELQALVCGDVTLPQPTEAGFVFGRTSVRYLINLIDGVRVAEDIPGLPLKADIFSSAVSYVEQLVYIMDPANFIIRRESNYGRQMREKGKKKGHVMLEKTTMRPHYVCLSEDETREFISGVAREPRPAHPVRGHWKTLMSERFVHKKGQKIHIKQYFTGQGNIEGRGGWHYQVMVKEAPDKLVPYDKAD